MAATCTLTSSVEQVGTIHSFAWTSHTDGSVAGIARSVPMGVIKQIKVVPNTGATQPTNLFDLTILDSDGFDILSGRGADLVNTGPTVLQFDPPYIYRGGTLTPTIAAAGSGKTGTIVLIVK